MSLLARVLEALERHGLRHCLIGAGALAAHGVSRSTKDMDLLTVSAAALEEGTWADLQAAGISIEVRPGDSEDPLAGVVRLSAKGERTIDIVVGRASWQRDVIERARVVQLTGLAIPVAEASDVVLLKLFAGGPQDLWDIQQLLDTPDGTRIAADAEARLGDLPPAARHNWDRIRKDRS